MMALLTLGCVMVSAETIKGSVMNTRGEAMPFVTISVLTQDSTLLTGAITDDDGKYEIEMDRISCFARRPKNSKKSR